VYLIGLTPCFISETQHQHFSRALAVTLCKTRTKDLLLGMVPHSQTGSMLLSTGKQTIFYLTESNSYIRSKQQGYFISPFPHLQDLPG